MVIAVCDDDVYFLKILQDLLKSKIKDTDSIIAFNNSAKFYSYIEGNPYPFDIVLLYIDMPTVDGLELGRSIRLYAPNAVIVLLTKFKQYALEAYEIKPRDYLIKPIDTQKLDIILEETRNAVQNVDMVTFQYKSDTYRIATRDILYIESFNWYLILQCRSEQFRIYKRMKDAEDMLSSKGFIRVQRSFLVNQAHIKYCSRKKQLIGLYNGETLPVSRDKVDDIIDYLGKERLLL